MKTCSSCKESLQEKEFYVSKNSSDGLYPCCRQCDSIRMKKKNNKPDPKVTEKTCTRCRVTKPVKEFARRKASRDGLQFCCIDCLRDKYWTRIYGLTASQYEDLLAYQNGVCAICLEPETTNDPRTGRPRKLAVDHCHKTGEVRGLLCLRCNSAIGKLADDSDRLRRAAKYLDDFNKSR